MVCHCIATATLHMCAYHVCTTHSNPLTKRLLLVIWEIETFNQNSFSVFSCVYMKNCHMYIFQAQELGLLSKVHYAITWV